MDESTSLKLTMVPRNSNRQYAENAISHVRSMLRHGSNTERDSTNPLREAQLITLIRKSVKAKAIQYAQSHHGICPFEVMIKLNYDALKENGYGHCGELAQAAFHYLKRLGVYPIDFCKTTVGSHNILVIGRCRGSDPNDITTWGKDAVVCDPWADRCYPISDFVTMQKPEHEVRYPAICYQDRSGPPHYLAGKLKIQESAKETRHTRTHAFLNGRNNALGCTEEDILSYLSERFGNNEDSLPHINQIIRAP